MRKRSWPIRVKASARKIRVATNVSSGQANVILEAVGETMEKKLNEKFDPVITKLDGIMKGVEMLQQENTVGAQQLRRHEDQLQDHAVRIKKLELSPST